MTENTNQINLREAMGLFNELRNLSNAIPKGDPLDDPSVVAITFDELPAGQPDFSMIDEGDEISYMMPEAPVFYGDPAHGGPVDAVMNTVRSYVANAIKSLGAATGKELATVKRSVNAVGVRVNSNNARINTLNNTVTNLRRQQAAVVNSYKRSKYLQAALSAAQALPGIQAHNFFFTPEHKSTLEALAGFAEGAEAMTIPAALDGATVGAVGGSFNQAELQAIVTALVGDRDDLIATVNAISDELATLKAKGEELHASTDAYRAYFAQPSTIMQVAKLVPSQLDDQEKSWVEAGLKILFGAAKAGGTGSTLSISI